MYYSLRPYQQDAFDAARAQIKAGRRAPLIVAPTGSGKTVIACHIVEAAMRRSTRTLFLAHRRELILQCSEKLHENKLPHGIIKAGIPADPGALVQVASVQTLVRRLDKLRQEYGLIIIDEAHHATAKTYLKILEANREAVRLGLTATPYRADGKGLASVFDCIVEVATIDELIAAGYLVRPRVFTGQKVDLTGVRTLAGDYNLGQLADAVNKPKLVGNIVEAWLKHASERLTVCFTVNIAHSQALTAVFESEGVAVAHLDGKTDEKERADILKRFAAGDVRVVCNCMVLTEGFDRPEMSCVIIARPTQSRSLWRQMCGRPLRPFPGQVDCLILDHGNVTERHGFLTDPDRNTLTDGTANERRRADRRCNACGAEYAGAPTYCPQCGEKLKKGEARLDKLINPYGDDQYELRERHPGSGRRRPGPSDPEQRLTWAAGLYLKDRATARAKEYKAAWAGMKYRGRIGAWPPGELQAAGEAM